MNHYRVCCGALRSMAANGWRAEGRSVGGHGWTQDHVEPSAIGPSRVPVEHVAQAPWQLGTGAVGRVARGRVPEAVGRVQRPWACSCGDPTLGANGESGTGESWRCSEAGLSSRAWWPAASRPALFEMSEKSAPSPPSCDMLTRRSVSSSAARSPMTSETCLWPECLESCCCARASSGGASCSPSARSATSRGQGRPGWPSASPACSSCWATWPRWTSRCRRSGARCGPLGPWHRRCSRPCIALIARAPQSHAAPCCAQARSRSAPRAARSRWRER
jgi:hypothetical protein